MDKVSYVALGPSLLIFGRYTPFLAHHLLYPFNIKYKMVLRQHNLLCPFNIKNKMVPRQNNLLCPFTIKYKMVNGQSKLFWILIVCLYCCYVLFVECLLVRLLCFVSWSSVVLLLCFVSWSSVSTVVMFCLLNVC
jgi:hypothetical protein